MPPSTRRNVLSPFLLGLLLALLSLTVRAQQGQALLTGRVVDETGQPVPSRVILGAADDPDLNEVVFTDDDGRFEQPFDAIPAVVSAFHGCEWAPARLETQLRPGRNEVRLVLRRLIDLEQLGWYCGDQHMHSTFSDGLWPTDRLAHAARCEDLDWAALTDHNTVAGLASWSAQARPGFLPIGGEEVTTPEGHIVALGVRRLVSPALTQGRTVADVFEDIHAQAGLAIIAHPAAPRMSYLRWDITDYDAVEAFNGNAPPYGGLYDLVQGRARWHLLLNEGRRLPCVASSDNHFPDNSLVRQALRDPDAAKREHPEAAAILSLLDQEAVFAWARRGPYVGGVRTYAKLEALTEGAVLAAVKAGHSFITNGPILLVQVNDTDPGTEVPSGPLRVRYRALSAQPLQRLQVLCNGDVAQTVDLAGQTEAAATIDLRAEGPGWVAVECYGQWPEIALTNAWYVAGEH